MALLAILSFALVTFGLPQDVPALESAQGQLTQSDRRDVQPVPEPPPPALALVAIPRVETPPTLDRVASGLNTAAIIEGFRQREPGDGLPVSARTVAYVSYDEKHLYVLVDCDDPGVRARAHLSKREDISDDDQVTVYIDTFLDKRRAYLFEVNPLGVQRDAILTEGQNTDYSFDAVWRSEGRLTETGYQVLIAIPFKSLRFPATGAQRWGFGISRYLPSRSERSYWPYVTGRIEGIVNQLGEVTGILDVSPGRNIQLIPYAVATGSQFLDTDGARFARTDEWRGGLDAKVVIKDAFTLDTTIRPDYSQVESDEPQVTINQRYEVYFPERRPFFIENAGFFVTKENLFFSRRIEDPEVGARITGKVGSWAIGAIAADDRAPQRRPTVEGVSADRAIAVAGRVQREFSNGSFLGFLGTDRAIGSSFASTFAVDGRIKLSPTWTFSGQAARTLTEAADGDRARGSAFLASIERAGRHLTYVGAYKDRSPELDVPLGFINRIDIRETNHYTGYLWRPADSALVAVGPAVSVAGVWNHARQLQDWFAQSELQFYFRRPLQLKLSHAESFERFSGLEFRKNASQVYFYAAPSQRLVTSAAVTVGHGINYSPTGDQSPYVDETLDGYFSLTLRPIQRLKLDEIYYYSRLGTTVFSNHLSRTRVSFQLTRALSARVIGDYSAYLPVPPAGAGAPSKRFTVDLLLTYLLNPFTAFYVGYAERYDNLLLDDGPPPSIRRTSDPSLRTARQAFVKLNVRFGL